MYLQNVPCRMNLQNVRCRMDLAEWTLQNGPCRMDLAKCALQNVPRKSLICCDRGLSEEEKWTMVWTICLNIVTVSYWGIIVTSRLRSCKMNTHKVWCYCGQYIKQATITLDSYLNAKCYNSPVIQCKITEACSSVGEVLWTGNVLAVIQRSWVQTLAAVGGIPPVYWVDLIFILR